MEERGVNMGLSTQQIHWANDEGRQDQRERARMEGRKMIKNEEIAPQREGQ
jgi:hypothetical protein